MDGQIPGGKITCGRIKRVLTSQIIKAMDMKAEK